VGVGIERRGTGGSDFYFVLRPLFPRQILRGDCGQFAAKRLPIRLRVPQYQPLPGRGGGLLFFPERRFLGSEEQVLKINSHRLLPRFSVERV